MIYISNLVAGLEKGLDDPQLLLEAVQPFAPGVGIELFLHAHSPRYLQQLEQTPGWLDDLPRTTHGPFIGMEATSAPDSAQGRQLFDGYLKAFKGAVRLGSSHLVFHSNERFVTPEDKPMLQRRCLDNLETLAELGDSYGVTLLMENLALPCKGTPLFDQEEFIAMFDSLPQVACLIDMGHLHLAGWDARRVISQLAPRIVGYHLHNNDGQADSHCRLWDGTMDYTTFFDLYRRYTPNADITLEYGDNHGITAVHLREDINSVLDGISCPKGKE